MLFLLRGSLLGITLVLIAPHVELIAGEIRLTWEHDGLCEDGRPECPVEFFRIYMSTNPRALRSNEGKLIGTVPVDEELQFEYSIPSDGKTRYFAIKAVDQNGVESEFSDIVALASTRISVNSSKRTRNQDR